MGHSIAIIDLSRPDTPREITYASWTPACDAVAAGLAARGLGRGDRVGILALNRTEYIEALYGTMRAGAIPVPLNIKLPAESLAFIAKDANLSLLFVDAAHRKVAPDVPTVDFDANYADFLKPGPFTAVEPAPRRHLPPALHLRLHRPPEGRAADPRRPGLADRRARQGPPHDARRPRARRRPALPQERAGVDQGRHGRAAPRSCCWPASTSASTWSPSAATRSRASPACRPCST